MKLQCGNIVRKGKRTIKSVLKRTRSLINFCGFYTYQIRILNRIHKKYGQQPIRVGFIGYDTGASCDVFSELYSIFAKDEHFDCSVVTVPYSHDDRNKMIERHREAFAFVKSLGFNVLPGYNEEKDCFNDYKGRFDITFFESEYDWLDPLFKVDNFRDTISFFVPYGQYLADNIVHHFSHKMLSEVYKIFPPSVAVRKMMCKYSQIRGINIAPFLGNPKTDRLILATSYNDVWVKSKPGQKRIIWAPHHTWADYSNFLEYYNVLLDYAKKNKDSVFIAFKPHPALRESLVGVNGWTEDEVTQYYNEWKYGENTALYEGGWIDLFQSSDAMILDSIGFMLEYSLTGKPACVIYRVNEQGDRVMKFSECGEELYAHLYHAKSMAEIETFIKMVLDGQDANKEARMRYLNANYIPPYGQSGSHNIYEYVLSIVKND